MKKVFISTLALAFLLTPSVGAQPNLIPAEVSPPGQLIQVPQTAIDQSPAIMPLGSAVDPGTGKKVEGIMFIHRKEVPTHKPQHSGSGSTTSGCFAYLSKGAKWKTVESWLVNPTNSDGLSSDFVFSKLNLSIAQWEDAADGVLNNGVSVNILGTGSVTAAALSADTTSPDNQNEIFFGDISDPGVIAVTIVWGIFSGPPFGRELVEFDMIYDDPDFTWGDAGPTNEAALGDTTVMDFENITMHELGHAKGMAHPSDSCTEETEYRFSQAGETKKRTLNSGDISGIDGLY